MGNRISGFYFLNASKNDKQMTLYYQLNETEAYANNIVFPKCRISYVFFFRNPDDDNKIYLSGKAANTLTQAMDQPFYSSKVAFRIIALGNNSAQAPINFMSNNATDQYIDYPYFEPECVPTNEENSAERIVRQAFIDGNASTEYVYFTVNDGLPAVGDTKIHFGGGDTIIIDPNGQVTIAESITQTIEEAPTTKQIQPISLHVF